jgi:hypothetical protein
MQLTAHWVRTGGSASAWRNHVRQILRDCGGRLKRSFRRPTSRNSPGVTVKEHRYGNPPEGSLARSPAVTVDTLDVGTLNGADRVHQLIVIDTFAKTAPAKLYAAERRSQQPRSSPGPKRRNGTEAHPCRRYSLRPALFEPPILLSVNL